MFGVSSARSTSPWIFPGRIASPTSLRYYGRWDKVDLPLLPKVAFVHRIFTSALNECEKEMCEAYVTDIRINLDAIRKINWNRYNTPCYNIGEILNVRKLLEDLKERENNLPKPLASRFENVCLFGSLQDAIDSLNDRNGMS